MSIKLFPSQLPNEKIYIAVREHWVLLLIRYLGWSFFALLLIIAISLGPRYFPLLNFEGLPEIIQIFLLIYTLGLGLGAFLIFIVYYLNLHIITDVRIVDIDQEGLFSHTISELNIDKIEDVTSQTNGFLGNIFDFGTVYIQTAGAKERFEFQNVPKPSYLAKIILDIYESQGPETKQKSSPTSSLS